MQLQIGVDCDALEAPTPWLMLSYIESEIISKERSKKNEPPMMVNTKVDVLLKRVLYKKLPTPAIFAQGREKEKVLPTPTLPFSFITVQPTSPSFK
jgi:hypothetical protein